MMLTVTEREKVHEAAEIFVEEFLKQLSSRVVFHTRHDPDDLAEPSTNSFTYICLDEGDGQ